MSTFTNKHGRKPGRGLRPWLLIPKILCVAAVFGGFCSVSVLLHSTDPQTHEQWHSLIHSIEALFLRLIVPAVCGVVLLGILLLLQHWRAFLKMRWVQAKLVILLIALPPLHLTGRYLIGQARLALQAEDIERVSSVMHNFTITIDIAVLAVAFVIGFARLKPRLGQRPKTVAEQRQAETPKA